jgi:hypothetical protein
MIFVWLNRHALPELDNYDGKFLLLLLLIAGMIGLVHVVDYLYQRLKKDKQKNDARS